MKKRLVMFMVLFTMIQSMVLNFMEPMKCIAEKDEVIEWNSYIEEKLI